MLFFKNKKDDAKKSLDSLEKAQKLLDDRFEKKQVSFEIYQKQCKEFGERREKLRKILGEDIFNQ